MELWVFWIKIAFITIIAIGMIAISNRRFGVHGPVVFQTPRVVTRIFAGFLLLLVALAIFDQQGRNSQLSVSPDDQYIARVMIGNGSILGSSDSAVILRRKGSLGWYRVYRGDGYTQDDRPAYPYVEWQSPSHLVISYHGVESEPSRCSSRVEAVLIECRARNW